MNIVWFKRDLRIHDHQALAQAAQAGPVLPLYILEPELWHQPDMSYRHYLFLQESLQQLDQDLAKLGQRLIVKIGNAVDVLHDLHTRHHINAIWSHQETWNGWTYARDNAVKRFCNAHHIEWHEPMQHGVIRCLNDRNGWAARWYHQMKQPQVNAPAGLPAIKEPSDALPSARQIGLTHDGISAPQKGGRIEGLALLNSFLHLRGEGYTKEMSSPVTAFDSCSRLSAHLAFGTLSVREVFQTCEKRIAEIKRLPRGQKGKWPSAMRSFSGRLRWHCHFMQKLEDEPRIEFENMHPAYDALRQHEFNSAYFEAWKSGMTGYPMVDACMRALQATGLVEFSDARHGDELCQLSPLVALAKTRPALGKSIYGL